MMISFLVLMTLDAIAGGGGVYLLLRHLKRVQEERELLLILSKSRDIIESGYSFRESLFEIGKKHSSRLAKRLVEESSDVGMSDMLLKLSKLTKSRTASRIYDLLAISVSRERGLSRTLEDLEGYMRAKIEFSQELTSITLSGVLLSLILTGLFLYTSALSLNMLGSSIPRMVAQSFSQMLLYYPFAAGAILAFAAGAVDRSILRVLILVPLASSVMFLMVMLGGI